MLVGALFCMALRSVGFLRRIFLISYTAPIHLLLKASMCIHIPFQYALCLKSYICDSLSLLLGGLAFEHLCAISERVREGF